VKAPLIITGRDTRRLLSLEECIDAVECAFRLRGEGRAQAPGVLGMHVEGGGFHIKSGVLGRTRPYFAAKVNGNFPGNPQRFGLPTIQGVLVLSDAENGRVLAVMDSMEITALRTGAATAVAAKYLARKDSHVATICGCGAQGRIQLRALRCVLRLRQVYAYDIAMERAAAFAERASQEFCIPVTKAADLRDALRQSDICVTCTPSRKAFLMQADVKPGTFIAAVGADHPEKQEVEPALMASSRVIIDVLDQCAAMGDLHHALEAGLMTRHDVHAELGEVVAGKKAGRESDEGVVIFDSTGMALQDVAAAAVVYEKAVQDECCMAVDFAA